MKTPFQPFPCNILHNRRDDELSHATPPNHLKAPHKRITEVSASEAASFFLEPTNYFQPEMPQYVNLGPVLNAVSGALRADNPNPLRIATKASELDEVNHTILANKDGRYAWRPFQIIHPVLYCALVNDLVQEDHWKELVALFAKRQALPHVACTSIPVIPTSEEKQRAGQIATWWNSFEQESVESALQFSSVIVTDLTDCYGSLYTHTIPWAIHGQAEAKAKKKDDALLGNRIDSILRGMHWGQTNGIPQGSVLMDFLAEVVLSAIDESLCEKIDSANISACKILRYRDDYRIFVNDTHAGMTILKLLTETVATYGFRLNSSKTVISSDIISSSIPEDRLQWMRQNGEFERLSIEKQLLMIYRHSQRFPNAGSLLKPLARVHKVLEGLKTSFFEPGVLVAIVAEIATRNPKTFENCIAIIAKLLASVSSKEREHLARKLLDKFRTYPNFGLSEIWLQKILVHSEINLDFEEPICHLVQGESRTLWPVTFLGAWPNVKTAVETARVVDSEILRETAAEFSQEEVDLFAMHKYDYVI